jgi:hypothetical protein
MTYKINRDDDPIEAKVIRVQIGLDRYRITETADGKMNINKVSDGDSDTICVYPRAVNEIEIS